MTKIEFLADLYNGLLGLPEEDIEERVNYYSEMVDDRIEEGLTEEEAIAQIGTPEQIISQILAEMPISTVIKTKKSHKFTGGEILLLALGFPIWFPLLIAAAAVLFSVYVSIWAVIVSLWSIPVSLAGCGIGGIIGGIFFAFHGHPLPGLALISAALVCAGLSIFAFYGCMATIEGTIILTKKLLLWIKKGVMRKEKGV